MPAKSHGKKRFSQSKPVAKGPVVQAGDAEPVGEAATPVAAAPLPVKQALKPTPATQPAPRHFYLGRELLRTGVVSAITLGILIILFFVLR